MPKKPVKRNLPVRVVNRKTGKVSPRKTARVNKNNAQLSGTVRKLGKMGLRDRDRATMVPRNIERIIKRQKAGKAPFTKKPLTVKGTRVSRAAAAVDSMRRAGRKGAAPINKSGVMRGAGPLGRKKKKKK